MTKKGKFKSGEKVPDSGIYYDLGNKREVTVVKGEPFPLSPDGFVLRRKTNK